MHYLGMYAIRGNCIIQYSWLGVSISILIAIQASGVALWFTFRQRGLYETFLGSVALGLAIALMHYSGMEATRFLPDDEAAGAAGLLLSDPPRSSLGRAIFERSSRSRLTGTRDSAVRSFRKRPSFC